MSRLLTTGLENSEFKTSEDFSQLLAQDTQLDDKKEGEIVKGKIIDMDNEAATIDVGLKSEGRIPLKEFIVNNTMPELNIGDEVEVFLQSFESRGGRVSLSHERAVRERSWNALEKAYVANEPVEGIIFGRVKGGLTVDLSGVIAFLPGSQVDVKPIKDITYMLGVKQPFMILKMDKEQGNVVVSRRAIIEESRKEARDEMLSAINVGDALEGIVKNITDYGAFVDLGSLDGLLHLTDISWSKINHPSELLSLGQKIKVQVIKYDEKNKRISLGMKQLEANPWQGLDEKYPVGKKLTGKVTNVTDYGIFIEIEPGVEGLVHVSEISWNKNSVNPRKIAKVGDEIEYVVLDIDVDKHRISLGMKQCSEDPWEEIIKKNPVGTEVECEVKKVTDHGLVVDFGEEVDGFIHLSDFSWNSEENKEVLKSYNIDDKIKAMVLSIDADKRRVNFGIKQLQEDPFEKACKDIKRGSVVTCTVKEVQKDGVLVTIGDAVETVIKKAELSSDKVEQRPERFAVGDRFDAKVTGLEKATRKVSVSVKALEQDEKKRKIAAYGSTSSGASLGDILGAALNAAEEKDKKK